MTPCNGALLGCLFGIQSTLLAATMAEAGRLFAVFTVGSPKDLRASSAVLPSRCCVSSTLLSIGIR